MAPLVGARPRFWELAPEPPVDSVSIEVLDPVAETDEVLYLCAASIPSNHFLKRNERPCMHLKWMQAALCHLHPRG